MNTRLVRAVGGISLLGALLWCGCSSSSDASTSTGGNWTKVTTFAPLAGGNSAYVGVQFVSSSVGYVCGGNSFVAKSTDGGKTWRKLDVAAVPGMNESSYFNALYFFDADDGWVTGNGWLLHTKDGGATWAQTMPSSPDLAIRSPQSVHFGDRLHGVVTGMYGKALYTADGGATWQKPVMDVDYENGSVKSDFTSVQLVDSNTGWIAGSSKTVLKTSDGGKTWTTLHNDTTSVTLDAFTGTVSPKLHFVDARTGYVALSGGMIKTTDGGTTWTALPDSPRANAFTFVSADVGFAVDELVGSPPAFSSTTNGGGAWTRQKTSNGGFRSMSFLDAKTGWALFGNGDLFTYAGQ